MKKEFRKLSAITLALVLLLLLAACGGPQEPEVKEVPHVGIMQLADHPALDASREGFKAALADNGYAEGEGVIINYQNAQGEMANCLTIADQFVGENVDLVLAIATPAVQAMAGKTAEIPILGTAVTDFVVAKLAESNEVPGGNVSGTSDMNPIREQIDLLTELAPEAKTVGLIYTSSEDNSVLQAGIAKDYIESLGLEYTEVTINNTSEVQQGIESLVQKCDAIYVPTDNNMSSAFTIVYEVTTNSKTPVICGEAEQVKKGGLATLSINYFDIGYQAGLMAVEILEGKADISTMPITGGSNLDFVINGTVADEIGLEIPDKYSDFIITME